MSFALVKALIYCAETKNKSQSTIAKDFQMTYLDVPLRLRVHMFK